MKFLLPLILVLFVPILFVNNAFTTSNNSGLSNAILDEFPRLVSDIKRNNEGVELVSEVFKNKGIYTYSYQYKNIGKEKSWLVASSVPDRAIGNNSSAREFSRYFLLKPGEITTLSIYVESPPKEFRGKIICLGKDENDVIVDTSLDIEGVLPTFYFDMMGIAVGYVPSGIKIKRK